MKKYLLLFAFILSSQFIMAQCTEDTSVSTWGMHPVPSVDLNGIAAVPETPAFIGESYSYTFSLVIPSSFEIPGGLGTIGVTNATVTEVIGLPSGMSFGECSSTSGCTIPGGTTGCFRIIGTPDASNAPGVYELSIKVTVDGLVVVLPQSVDLSFPPISSAFNPFGVSLDPYAITLNPAVSTSDLLAQELTVSENKPNPFSQVTTIDVEAVKGGDYTFSVTSLLGKTILDKEYTLATGNNSIEFDGSNLSNGIYIYSLSNELGTISKKMIVSK